MTMCTNKLRDTRLIAQKIYGTKVTEGYVSVGLFTLNVSRKFQLWLGKRYAIIRIGLGYSYFNVNVWNQAHRELEQSNSVKLSGVTFIYALAFIGVWNTVAKIYHYKWLLQNEY